MKKLKKTLYNDNIQNENKNLSELDELYHSTVGSFPKDEKIKYCQRLIARLNYELKNNSSLDKKQEKEFNQILIAAKNEIQNIGVD